jgi:hypothetical protein
MINMNSGHGQPVPHSLGATKWQSRTGHHQPAASGNNKQGVPRFYWVFRVEKKHKVLLGFSWLSFTGFQAEFSAVKKDPDSIVFKDTEASCCRLDGLNPAVESLGDSIPARPLPSKNTGDFEGDEKFVLGLRLWRNNDC